MAASIIAALAAVAAAVISAIATVKVAKLNQKTKEQNDKINEHNENREKEAALQGRMITAICDLTDVTATAVKGGYTNGNLEEAQKNAKAAKADYNKFLKEVALKEITK